MQLITAPINPGSIGDTVKNLHYCLFLAKTALNDPSLNNLYNAPDFKPGYIIEVNANSYSIKTVQLVTAFQTIRNIKFEVAGNVDLPTMVEINKWVNQFSFATITIPDGFSDYIGTPVITNDGEKFTVSGYVVNSKNEKISSQLLLAYDVDLKGARLYRSAKTLSQFGSNGGVQFLGAAISDDLGYYEINFTRDFFQQNEFSPTDLADVIVFAFQSHLTAVQQFPDDNNPIVGRSALSVKNNYTKNVLPNWNVLIENGTVRGETEYGRLQRILTPFLTASQVALTDLKGSTDQINFLAAETGTDSSNIASLVAANLFLSNALAVLIHVPAFINPNIPNPLEMLYGLVRQNIILDWTIIAVTKNDVLQKALQTSISANIIKAYNDEAIKEFLNDLERGALQFSTQPDAAGNMNNISKTLSFALGNDADLQAKYLSSYRNFSGKPADFWKVTLVPQGFTTAQISSLQLTNQLDLITNSHLPLMEELQVNRKITSPLDLLQLSDNDWKQIVDKTGVTGIPNGASDSDKSNYINSIQAILNTTFPNQKVASMIGQGAITIADNDLNKGLVNFLTQQAGFNILKNPVNTITIKEQLNAVHPEAFEKIKHLQRILQVSPTPMVMSTLFNENTLLSSRDIAMVPPKNFVANYADKLGGADVASLVHGRAQYLTKRIDQTFITIYNSLHGLTPSFSMSEGNKELLGGDSTGALLSKVQDYFPDWESLFGIVNIDECEDCQSITSPAAYLVDLLQFLSVPKNGTVSPLDVLFTRRPDIGELPLTCENTNTVIPYIDLVNEIMEYYTANGGLTAAPYKGYDTGETTTAELHANPQNTNKEAYRILSNNTAAKKCVYPFSLPYHQPLDRIRLYLRQFKTSRAELMEVFRKDTDPNTTAAINAEVLGISPEEYQVLITVDPATVFQFYGYGDNNTMLAEITNAQVFIRRAGIAFTDLVDIAEARFINPGKPQFLYLENLFLNKGIDAQKIYQALTSINSGTDLSNADSPGKEILQVLADNNVLYADFKQLVKDYFLQIQQIITLYQSDDDISKSGFDVSKTFLKTIQSLYDPAIATNGIVATIAGKLHRFIRLWKKMGWAVHDLDTVIIAMGENDVIPALINKMAALQKINTLFSLPVQQISCLWGNIDTYGSGSLYSQLFLNRAIKEIDPVFQPDALGAYFRSNNEPVSGHITVLQAAMKVSADDLTLILNDFPFAANAVLSLESLSAIYRYVLLAKALAIPVNDLIVLKQLSGINPFPVWDTASNKFINIDPQSTLTFIQLAQKAAASGFTATLLNYIINSIDPNGKIQLQTEVVLQALGSLQATVIKINNDNPDPGTSATGETVLRKKMQLLFSQNVTDSFFALINSNVYSVKGPVGLALSKLPSNIQYNSITGSLQCLGILGDDFQAKLSTLKDDNNTAVPQTFIDAVTALYSVPDNAISDFITHNFNDFIAAANIAAVIKDIKKNQSLKQDPPLNLFTLFYSYFLPYLKNILTTNSVVQQIAALIGLEEVDTNIIIAQDINGIAQKLIKPGLTFTTDNADAMSLVNQAGVWYRAALFINGFKLTPVELSYFKNNGGRFNGLDFFKITFQHWSRIEDYAYLRNQVAPTPDALIKIFDAANVKGATIQSIIGAGLLDGKMLPQLNTWFGINDVTNFQDEVVLTKINKALKLVQTLGIPLSKLAPLPPVNSAPPAVGWALPTNDFNQLWDIAEDIKRTLKAKYADDDWLLLAKNISKQIRENQKLAVIAWLLVQPELQLWGVTDADSLFEYLLIDIQMDACMDTSRIVQALSSIQLFVDRVLLNLESNRAYSSAVSINLTPDSIDDQQWPWRKYYRVWQAAREVFLYPENWLQPELRDDKSIFFKELESELLQNDITPDTTDTAFRNYLTKLEVIANLDVWGMYQSDPSDPASDLYVFARTHHAPYSYYWRTKTNMEWSNWDKIEVDIRGVDNIQKPGVHLLPVFWKNRVILFWPEFTPKTNQNTAANSSSDSITVFAGTNHFSDLLPDNYWEIRLAWTEFKGGKWQPKVLSNEPLIPGYMTRDRDINGGNDYYYAIDFPAETINSSVVIEDFIQFNFFGYSKGNPAGPDFNIPIGSIVVNSLHNKLQVIPSTTFLGDSSDWESFPSNFGNNYSPEFQKWERGGTLHLSDNDYLTSVGEHTVLAANEVTDLSTSLQYPFFFQDIKRAYFVSPASVINYSTWIADPNEVPPSNFKMLTKIFL